MGETGMLEGNPVIDIFELRRQSAARNLDALVEFVKSIKDRTTALRKLREQLAHDGIGILSNLNTLRTHVVRLRADFNSGDHDKSDMKGSIDNVDKYFALLESAIQKSKEHWKSISGLKLDPEMIENGDHALGQQIEDCKRKLQKLELPGDDLRKRWKEMEDLNEFWEVSLDYLAGVSLRHDGLDMDVCGIADDLIRELQECCKDLEALTILGRDCCNTSLPQIVYLRFPEWTMWVLPLAAGELWRDVSRPAGQGRVARPTISESYFSVIAKAELARPDMIKADPQSGKKREENTVYHRWLNKPLLKDCLTDIFGTFALGPSYVLSSIFLALDPSDDHDRIRAETILYVMEAMNNDTSIYPNTANASLRAIAGAWEQAVRETGRSNGLLPEDVKKREDLAKWRDSFLNYLRNFVTLQFPIVEWDAGKKTFVDYFLSPNPASDSAHGPGTIRLALAAAWEARIGDPLKSKDIANACKQRCEHIASKGQPSKPEAPNEFVNSNA